jgi:hypothetical protein
LFDPDYGKGGIFFDPQLLPGSTGYRSNIAEGRSHPIDFSSESAWESICAVIREPDPQFHFLANVDFVSDEEYDGLSIKQLLALVPEESDHTFLFVVDHTTLQHSDHPVLVVDLFEEPGRAFRAIPSEMWSIENNGSP